MVTHQNFADAVFGQQTPRIHKRMQISFNEQRLCFRTVVDNSQGESKQIPVCAHEN